jgi:hypothetical protein
MAFPLLPAGTNDGRILTLAGPVFREKVGLDQEVEPDSKSPSIIPTSLTCGQTQNPVLTNQKFGTNVQSKARFSKTMTFLIGRLSLVQRFFLPDLKRLSQQ